MYYQKKTQEHIPNFLW